MFYYAAPFLISAIIFLLFAYFSFRRKRSTLSIIFTSLLMSVFFWQLSWFLLQIFPSQGKNIAIIGHIFILFIPVLLYHFGSLVVSKVNNFLLYLFYFWIFILQFLLVFSELIISGVHEKFWGIYPMAGDLHYLFIITVIIMVATTLDRVFRAFLNTKIIEQKKQFLYTGLGIGFFSLSAVDFLANYNFDIYPFGVVFLWLFGANMFYGISKYNLISTKELSDKFFVIFFLWIVMSLTFYGVILVEELFIGSVLAWENVMINLIVMPFFIFFFIELYKKLSEMSQRIFKTFDIRKHTLDIFTELPHSEKAICEYLEKKFSIMFDADVFVLYKDNEVMTVANPETEEEVFTEEERGRMWKELQVNKKFAILGEQKLKLVIPNSYREYFISILDQRNIEVYFPFRNKDIFVLIGKKNNGKRFSSKEIKFFRRLSEER